MASDPTFGEVMPPSSVPCAKGDPIAGYREYLGYAAAWMQYEETLDRCHLYRNGQTGGPPRQGVNLLEVKQVHTLLSVAARDLAQRSRQLKPLDEVAFLAMSPLDVLDDLFAHHGPQRYDLVVLWVRSQFMRWDHKTALTHAFAEGRYTLRQDQIGLGTSRSE